MPKASTTLTGSRASIVTSCKSCRLAAGALESTRILLNSQSPATSQGVGNSNGVLGHYLIDHFTIEDAGGLMPGCILPRAKRFGRPCGFLIPKYVNTVGSAAKDRNSKFCAATASMAMAARSFTTTPFS